MKKTVTLTSLFVVKAGDYHATKELDAGSIPLISCGDTDNGLVGYYDIPTEKTYENSITVAFNGLPLTTKYHPYKFGAKDDVAVLIPREPMSKKVLVYISALLNLQKWRYSYGRKCFREKLELFEIVLPYQNRTTLDTAAIEAQVTEAIENVKRKTGRAGTFVRQSLS
jgi:type I restriction enzyme M protein